MPRSSRHKSHKQSKHSSKEAAKEYYSESDEDSVVVRMKDKDKEKERVRKEDGGGGGGSVRVSRDSGEKRKLSSSREGKEGKDLNGNGNGNGDALEEYVSSKRRKGGDGGGRDDGAASESLRIADSERSVKSSKESKGLGDSRSKSSKRQEGGGEKEERLAVLVEKEDRSGGGSGRAESKRKSEGRKEGKDKDRDKEKEKEKDRASEREKKGQEMKREDTVSSKKQGSQWGDDGVEDRYSKKGREINEVPPEDDFRNVELEKELEKRIRKRRESSGDRDKGHGARDTDEKQLASKSDRPKDGRHKDKDVLYTHEVEKYDRHGDAKYRDIVDKDIKYLDDVDRDTKYRDDVDRDTKYRDDVDRDTKYRDDVDRDTKYRDDVDRDTKYRDDVDRDTKYRDDVDKDTKYRDDVDRDTKYRDDVDRDTKYRDDVDRDTKYRDDVDRDTKYRNNGDRDNKYKDDKYRGDGEKDTRRRDDRYREDGDRETRRKDDRSPPYDDRSRSKDDQSRKRKPDREEYGDSKSRSAKDQRFDAEKLLISSSRADSTNDRGRSTYTDTEARSPPFDDRETRRKGDTSPPYDDRSRSKDDQGRKKKSDKEDYGDSKSRSAKDQRHDAEKRPISSSRADSTNDRGRSTLRNTDSEAPNRSRHQGSPSSREHYRHSKQDESKYRDYAYEDRGRHSTSTREYGGPGDKLSSSRVVEKNVLKDDSHLLDLSAERRSKTDTRSSPRQLLDKSPSSLTMDRRHLSRTDVRRSIDAEESGQRGGVSRDPKDYYVKEGRGNRDKPRDTLPGDDPSQPDGDNMSISSPFVRSGHFSGNSKSHAPPPFRTGSDGPSNFGSSEDDNRMKFSNRNRRSDSNIARVHPSPWKGVPNWPSPMPNGFIPFQHGLHPVMSPFSPAPIFNVRPSMDLNHHGVPYHMPDGRPMAWRNTVDDSYPPPLQVWDPNNGSFSEEHHIYGRPDWDHGRTLPSSVRPWETNDDMWKGPKVDANMEMQFSSEKDNQYPSTIGIGSLGRQSVEPVQNDETLTDLLDEGNETRHSSVALENKSPENSNATHAVAVDKKKSEKDTANLYQVYLSKLDISAELTDPELYSKCAGLMDVGQNAVSDAEDSKILYVENISEVKSSSARPSSFVFGKINDSIFQKAMTLYKKQREEFVVVSGGENPKLSNLCIEAPKTDSAQDVLQLPVSVKSEDVSMEEVNEVLDGEICVKSEDVTGNELDGAIFGEGLVKPEMATGDHVATIGNCVPLDMELESSGVLPAASVEEMAVLGDSMGGNETAAGMGEEIKLPETKACEVVMEESIESGSVKLSRIHHNSPESTH